MKSEMFPKISKAGFSRLAQTQEMFDEYKYQKGELSEVKENTYFQEDTDPNQEDIIYELETVAGMEQPRFRGPKQSYGGVTLTASSNVYDGEDLLGRLVVPPFIDGSWIPVKTYGGPVTEYRLDIYPENTDLSDLGFSTEMSPSEKLFDTLRSYYPEMIMDLVGDEDWKWFDNPEVD